ncbi:MAG: MFS transporter [Chloroflexota bacterium]
MKLSKRFPALASQDFSIFWVGQFLSLIGTWMQSTTLPYLAYRLTGKPLDLGLIGFAATLPTLILALPAGVIVERLDNRKTVIVMQFIMALQALTLAILTLTGHIQMWHIAFLAFILGSASAFEITARQSMLVELVGKAALPNAIALQTAIFNGARVLGPSISAVVLVLIKNQGEGWAFLFNSVSYLFIIIGLFFVKTPFKAVSINTTSGERNLIREFKEGQRYILGNSTVGLVILMAALIGFFGFPFIQQIPALARDVLHQISDTETIVKTRNSALYIAQGIGALIASVYISLFSGLKRKGVLLAIGQVIFAASLILISITKSIPLNYLLMVILGWAMVTQLALMNTLIQINIPDSLRGRVFSTYLWALQGVAPFGSLFIGWMAQTRGIPSAALVSGIACLVSVLSLHILKPSIVRKTY